MYEYLCLVENKKNLIAFFALFVGVLIRRKKSDMNPLQQVFVPPILSAQTPTKFIIEVANSTYTRGSESGSVCFYSIHFQFHFFVFLFFFSFNNICDDVDDPLHLIRNIVKCDQVAPSEFMQKVTNLNRLPAHLIRLSFQSVTLVFAHMIIWCDFTMTAVDSIKSDFVKFFKF